MANKKDEKQNVENDLDVIENQVTIEDFAQEVKSNGNSDTKEKTSQKSYSKSTDKKGMKNNSGDGGKTGVISKSIEQVIHESMMPYSEYVILDRALPRVEDGLKPVQRRVLYSMYEMGVTPDKPFRKSATMVGNCMGKYHPHGDRSIYDTLVRMAQNFNMGLPLIEGHGNFGSVDGDGAAAMRYTESRLSEISLELLKDIEKDTVSWSFNFDDSRKEPDMLPGRFPNLLVNGSTGIAVGLATNIPTHNLNEAIDSVVAYIDKPNITLNEILKIMPGPDFSTGGYILAESEFKRIYETGRGKVIMRAKLFVEPCENDKKNIVITEIPYQVNKANMLQKIALLKEKEPNGILSFISEIVDESDRHGTRAVIKLKKDANVNAIINYLYKKSDLQTNFNVNMVAIADGKPKQLGLLEIIKYYVNYQKSVVLNRTKFDLDAAEKRAHILEGLLIAIQNIDEVVKIIKTSKSVTNARQRLMDRFKLTQVQAQAILDMRLARLTNLEVTKLVKELEDLKKLIIELTSILESEKKLMRLIKKEMLDIKNKYSTERKAQIIDVCQDDEDVTYEEISVQEDVHIIYTAGDTIKAVTQKSYNLTVLSLSANPNLSEIPKISLISNNFSTLYLFTNLGNCHKIKISDIPIVKFKDKGAPLSAFIKKYEPNERVLSIFEFDESDNESEMIFATKLGLIKISKQIEYISSKQTISAIKLKSDDEVVYVDINNKEKSLLMFSNNGMAVNVAKDDIKTLGRVSSGVKGMLLNNGDFVVNCVNSKSLAYVLFTSSGHAKVIKESQIPVSARGRKGLKVISTKPLNNTLISAFGLAKNINYVAVCQDNSLVYIENRKLVLENRQALGKIFLPKNSAPVQLVTEYVTNN